MLSYIIRRILIMIPMMFVISVICFTIIKLQPGSYISQYLENGRVSPQTVLMLKKTLGLDKPAIEQYFYWLGNIVLHGNFGYSFAYQMPVTDLIWQYMGWTVVVSLLSMAFTWLLAIPLGIYSARHRYGVGDYAATFLGYIGMSIPDFFLALLLMYLALSLGSRSVGGLFSVQYVGEPWSVGKFIDLSKHLWIPMIAIGAGGIGGLMRIMRGNMMDVLNSPMILSLKARGIGEKNVTWKHAVKNAVNPLVTIAGMSLPGVFSSTIIASIVLNIPTMGPFFYSALMNHDQYLVMAYLLLLALLLQIGNLLADIALAFVDPRIRYT